LLIEQMIAYGKLNMTHVPYRGGAAAMTDFLAGRVDATLATLLFARPYIQDNRGIGVAVGNAERSPVLPNMPAVQEVIPGAKLTDGLAVLAPAATPAAIIARANRALQDVINQPTMRDWLTNEGVPPRPGPPEAFMAEMTPATDDLRKLLRDAAIKLE
jgi:tripartite-type tricarboxylate transporter receptor subunit TctC